MGFAEDLATTNVLFWRQTRFSFLQVTSMLTANAVLLVLCKSASFGFSDLSVPLITTIISAVFQYLASVASIFKRDGEGIQIDAPKLAKTMTMIWLLSLTVFLPNAFRQIRWFGVIDSPLAIAATHSLVAILLLTYYSFNQLSRSPISEHDLIKEKRSAIYWGGYYFIVNTTFFYLFVLDSDTHYWILENSSALKSYF